MSKIETLRQQVKDADKRGDDALRRALDIETQLAALKAGQDEPVVWLIRNWPGYEDDATDSKTTAEIAGNAGATVIPCATSAEVESLRQRVNEWSDRAMEFSELASKYAEGPDWIQRAMQAEAVLDTMMEAQGEPVGVTFPKYVCGEGDSVGVKWVEGKRPPAGTKLYTSAPTIPAGWQLMDMGWLASMLHVNVLRTCPEKSHEEIAEAVDKFLAAAPKGETA